ncbi:B3 domain-containing protein [Rhynchospora pubera]|uniref:B3 domain-containing protein n=1 Tax=Rhynchospora pubera TaxID=906938 RepID=A0AAV8F329_9POAL|nr:B3 domain-containing protein [Rhynchospora pubera]
MVVVEEIDDMDWTEVKRPNPHFFKILVGDFTQRMRIPPNFVKHLQEDITAKPSSSLKSPTITASIEGPTGRTWHVELEKTTTGTFFTTGWSKFVEDHSLKEHELLIFRYNGCMSFTLLIFDKTACEKEHGDDDGVSGNDGRQTRLKPRKLNFGEETSVPSTEHYIIDTETEDEENVTGVETSTRKRKKGFVRSKRSCKPLSKRCPVTEKEKLNAQKAAQSFASENPYFMIRLKPSHIYSKNMQLRLPVEFSRRFLPRSKTEVVLRVSANSNTWSVAYLAYVTDRDRLSRGWISFVRDNSLEVDDYCAFELVKSAEFLVHIFRVSDLPPLSPSRARKMAKT